MLKSAIMQKKYLAIPVISYSMYMMISFASCHNGAADKVPASDTVKTNNTLPPPSTISDATNPALADTAYQVDSVKKRR